MPRPNPGRTRQTQDNLARRIAFERAQRGWTVDGLASRLAADAQCPIHASAIYKIEAEPPQRAVSVDELVAFSIVFDTPIAELLEPVGVVLDRTAAAMIAELVDHIDRLANAAFDMHDWWLRLLDVVRDEPDLHDRIEALWVPSTPDITPGRRAATPHGNEVVAAVLDLFSRGRDIAIEALPEHHKRTGRRASPRKLAVDKKGRVR